MPGVNSTPPGRAMARGVEFAGLLQWATTDETLAAVAKTVEETAKSSLHRAATKGTAPFKKGQKVAKAFIGGRPTLQALGTVRSTTLVDAIAEKSEKEEREGMEAELKCIDAETAALTIALRQPENRSGPGRGRGSFTSSWTSCRSGTSRRTLSSRS